MKLPLYVCTSNQGKLKEIKELILEHFADFFSDFHAQSLSDLEETEKTFIGNAQLKAAALDNFLKQKESLPYAVLADDSGLCVDLLGGAPGIYSARYAGVGASSSQMITKILSELKIKDPAYNLEQRSAHFRCALSLIIRAKNQSFLWNVEARCNGQILNESRGDKGFGYDPIFFLPELNKSFSELSPQEKNTLSHRARAFVELKKKAGAQIKEL